MDIWVSAKALGRRLGRKTPGCPRKEQGGCGESREADGLVPDVVRGLEGRAVPLGLGFPFSKMGRGGRGAP